MNWISASRELYDHKMNKFGIECRAIKKQKIV